MKTENTKGCGEIKINKNLIVTKFKEKPKISFSKYIYSGIQIINSNIFELESFVKFNNSKIINLDFGYDIYPMILGQIAGYGLKCFAFDIGNIKSYQSVNEFWSNSNQILKYE